MVCRSFQSWGQTLRTVNDHSTPLEAQEPVASDRVGPVVTKFVKDIQPPKDGR